MGQFSILQPNTIEYFYSKKHSFLKKIPFVLNYHHFKHKTLHFIKLSIKYIVHLQLFSNFGNRCPLN